MKRLIRTSSHRGARRAEKSRSGRFLQQGCSCGGAIFEISVIDVTVEAGSALDVAEKNPL